MHGQHRTVHRRPNGLVGRLCRIAGRYAREVRRQVQIPCGAQCNEPCRRLAVRFLAASRRRHGWFPCRRHRPPPRPPRSTVSSARFRRVPAARNARPTPTIVRFKGYQIGSWLPRPRALAPARRLPPSTPSTPDATPGARPPAACPSPHFSPGRFVGVKKLMGFKKLTATPTITPIADCAGRARPRFAREALAGLLAPCVHGPCTHGPVRARAPSTIGPAMLSVPSARSEERVRTEPKSSAAPVRARIITAPGEKCGLARHKDVPPNSVAQATELVSKTKPRFVLLLIKPMDGLDQSDKDRVVQTFPGSALGVIGPLDVGAVSECLQYALDSPMIVLP